MQVFQQIDEARNWVRQQRAEGHRTALVPTMGALHQGHLSLVELGRQRCEKTIATIFVNPTQFGPGEDFEQYPRLPEEDLQLLRQVGTDAVFLPDAAAMYPTGFSTAVSPPDVAGDLEGRLRPGHFAGVATVVLKLFQILPTTHAVFGRKDYQQLLVIAAMVRDLNVDIEIIDAPIVREADGLAMSSRNRYLNPDERQTAKRLSAALQACCDAYADGNRDADALQSIMHTVLTESGKSHPPVDCIDYAVVRGADDLRVLNTVTADAIALIAAKVGSTRLIDNRVIGNTD
ncbi:pantoate--beta-alanine ligase [Crateriforma conspicua]|uniref:Pantothenate synthetase n=1 Tax=Crateriforma conspicua TaxID=2527996 RepID=A0A5C6FYR0_9PLAN|nr:pantoate--beta-alanine ligase [Crateriforma conspicua]TWU66163.1 Pantoate-beta-alanine ligase [Crateriforma conspicua]